MARYPIPAIVLSNACDYGGPRASWDGRKMNKLARLLIIVQSKNLGPDVYHL
jgi:hypothetical protein